MLDSSGSRTQARDSSSAFSQALKQEEVDPGQGQSADSQQLAIFNDSYDLIARAGEIDGQEALRPPEGRRAQPGDQANQNQKPADRAIDIAELSANRRSDINSALELQGFILGFVDQFKFKRVQLPWNDKNPSCGRLER